MFYFTEMCFFLYIYIYKYVMNYSGGMSVPRVSINLVSIDREFDVEIICRFSLVL